MANKYANLVSSRSEYARVLPNVKSGFRGVDFSSSPHQVELYRLPDLQNMYRDYRSDEGGALETIPGFRRLTSFEGAVNGIFRWDNREGETFLAVHAGEGLYLCKESERDTGEWCKAGGTLADNASRAFVYNGAFYILDGKTYQSLTGSDGAFALAPVTDNAYVPLTWLHGEEYEQRNALTDWGKSVFYGNDGVEMAKTSDTLFNGNKYLGRDTCYCGPVTKRAHSFSGSNARMFAFYSTDLGFVENFAMSSDDLSNVKCLALLAQNRLAIVSGSFGCFSDLTTLYLMKGTDGEGFTISFPQEEKLLMKEGGRIFFSGRPYQVVDNDAYYFLPPNVVARQGARVQLGEFKICGLSNVTQGEENLFVISSELPTDEEGKIALDPQKIYIHNDFTLNEKEDALTYNKTLVVTVGSEVSEGRHWSFGFMTNEYGETEYFLYRVEVFAKEADDVPLPVQDVYEYAAKPLVFNLPQKTKDVISVTSEGMEMGYGCCYDSNGDIYAVAVMTRDADNEIEIKTVSSDYHITSSNATFLDANPDYKGTSEEAINGCTLCAVYDDRIFLSGNPALPNTVFYSQRNNLGMNDPSYFGILNYFNDGVGWERVTNLFGFSDTLCVTKENTVFYHQGADADGFVTRIYPSTRGNVGLGSLGACCNFLDDPVMLTRSGIYGVNKETLTLERTLGRRSATIDARLLNEKNLASAEMVEWEGYLCLFINGNVYMADSRARYADATGNAQYEWFYLSGVGTWDGGKKVFASVTGALTIDDKSFEGVIVTVDGGDYALTATHKELYFDEDEVYTHNFGLDEEKDVTILYAVKDGRAYAVYPTGEITREGNFVAACHPAVVGDRLYFGNRNGDLFVFNNDKKGEAVNDEEVGARKLHRSYYTFAGHRIDSGFTTRLDDCDAPHLCKTTSSRSLTVRAKIMENSAYSIAVLTDKNYAYDKAERFTASPFTFGGADFNKVSFHAGNSAAIVGREKEKRWIEKQYLFRDGGFMQPFGIYSVAYRYRIAGRIRE